MRDYYAEVRSLISEGVLYRSFTSRPSNLHIKLRNPEPRDIDWAFEHSPYVSQERETALLSRCIHSINGRVFDRMGYSVYSILEEVSELSIPVHRRLLITLNSLIAESQRAYEYLEAYSYESESRSLWMSWKAKSAFTAPADKELNSVQLNWIIWNQMEDERKKIRTEWEQALLVTSAMNSKGAKEIRGSWENEDKRIEEYRENLMEQAREGNIDPVSLRQERKKKDSFEDLKEEMKRWVSGEEDEHDRIVREYKNSMYKKIEDEKRRVAEARERNIKRMEDISALRNSSSISSPIMGLTDEEVSRIASTTKTYRSYDEHAEKFEHVKERYITAREVSPNVSVDGEGNLVSSVPQKTSLMDQISNRTPKLD
tara:strand:+ start:1017 stop:2129 length:1113 start_codon:yes stop_codon:yes gene_type:complete